MPMLLLLLLFAEVAALIKLGQTIGGGFVLLEIVATAALGFGLFRLAGRTFLRTNELIAVMANPSQYLRQSGWALILAGLLLIVPGVLSDLFALVLLGRFLWGRISGPRSRGGRSRSRQDGRTIDVEYHVHDDTSE